jgi:hypothetical protein
VASESGKRLKTKLFYLIILAIEGKPCKIIFKKFGWQVKHYKSCIVWIVGNHPQSLKVLMLDSALVLWRKGEKEFAKIEKILKFNANKQL